MDQDAPINVCEGASTWEGLRDALRMKTLGVFWPTVRSDLIRGTVVYPNDPAYLLEPAYSLPSPQALASLLQASGPHGANSWHGSPLASRVLDLAALADRITHYGLDPLRPEYQYAPRSLKKSKLSANAGKWKRLLSTLNSYGNRGQAAHLYVFPDGQEVLTLLGTSAMGTLVYNIPRAGGDTFDPPSLRGGPSLPPGGDEADLDAVSAKGSLWGYQEPNPHGLVYLAGLDDGITVKGTYTGKSSPSCGGVTGPVVASGSLVTVDVGQLRTAAPVQSAAAGMAFSCALTLTDSAHATRTLSGSACYDESPPMAG